MSQTTLNLSRLRAARDFQADFSNTSYYFFASAPTPEVEPWPRNPDDDGRDVVESWRKMVFGKQITANGVLLGIRRIDYTVGESYASYLDTDPELLEKDYYAVVNAGAYYHCWKCLENAANGVSNVAPDIADVDPSGAGHVTSDGYKWKYMFTVSSSDVLKFATPTVFPVVANSEVEAVAVDGAVDTVEVLNGGQGFDNFATGTFSSGDVRVGGNTIIYAITSNSGASTLDDFYTGCLLYVSSGTGAGQWATVEDYFSNSSGKFCVIDSPFATPPQNSSQWELYPKVQFSNSSFTVEAVARAIVNASGNNVSRIEILRRGSGYVAAAAEVLAAGAVDATSANVRVVTSPPGGHGADAAAELGGRYCLLYNEFNEDESNTIPTTGYYQRVGIIRDPKFDGVDVTCDENMSAVQTGEAISTISARLITTTLTTTVDEANVTGTDLDRALFSGDLVLLESSDGVTRQLATVNSITNSTHAVLDDEANFSGAANVSASIVERLGTGTAANVSSNVVSIDGWRGELAADSTFLGEVSGTKASVVSVSRGGEEKDFSTFVQARKLQVNVTAGSFESGEVVSQGNAAGLFHSVTDGTMLLTETYGTFDTSDPVVGANSGATADVSLVLKRELEYRSGETIYLEYSESIDRSPSQTERFTVAFKF